MLYKVRCKEEILDNNFSFTKSLVFSNVSIICKVWFDALIDKVPT